MAHANAHLQIGGAPKVVSQGAVGAGINFGVLFGDPLRIASQRGELRASAFVTPAVQPGQVFLPMHDRATNLLTHPDFDPYSHQPAYKACAVSVEAAR